MDVIAGAAAAIASLVSHDAQSIQATLDAAGTSGIPTARQTPDESAIIAAAIAAVVSAGAVPLLLPLLKPPHAEPLRTSAAAACAGMASTDVGQTAIAAAHGIRPIVEQLRGPAMRQIARAVAVLSPTQHRAIARAGGVAALAGLRRCGAGADAATQGFAIMALRYMAEAGHHARFEEAGVLPAVACMALPIGIDVSLDHTIHASATLFALSKAAPTMCRAVSDLGFQFTEADGGLRTDIDVPSLLASRAAVASSSRTADRSAQGWSCEVCGSVEEAMVCSGCQQVAYCGAACQLTHWKQHKPSCRAAAASRAASGEAGV